MRLHIPSFDGAQVLVAGDLMLDRYWQGAAARISPEAPVPVVRVEAESERPGGAGNVALGVAALGASVRVVGAIGADPAGERLGGLLRAAGVACSLREVAGWGTVTKLRVLSHHQQLIRLDFEREPDGLAPTALLEDFRAALAEADVAVLSDYGKGTVRGAQELIRAAREARCPVLVDPKGRDFGAYRGADLVTPNRAEFEAVAGPCADEDTLVRSARALLTRHEIGALLITRGEQGMLLVPRDDAPLALAAHAREVYDVTGAGDTVIAVVAAGLAAGMGLQDATALANLAAGLVVGKLGAASVTVPELRRAVHELEDSHRGVVTEEELLVAVADARAHGETVVMTNGCFDLLHAGHVAYLEEARRLGQRLVVAVNDDASVRRLKGHGRPVLPLAQRLQVLAALRCVDWVVPFAEDTPERLIRRVLPDILVKGGDYRAQDIAGGAAVAAAGGRAQVLPYREGCSTSALIDAIRREADADT